jgi:hypothetical protein
MFAHDRSFNRYELTDDKHLVIDVSVRAIEDLYDNFDRTATYPKRDLDLDFANHLISDRQIESQP